LDREPDFDPIIKCNDPIGTWGPNLTSLLHQFPYYLAPWFIYACDCGSSSKLVEMDECISADALHEGMVRPLEHDQTFDLKRK
jgi:hypothetical protein